MQIFDAILYGIIQGITEFLPVSSSAHLALLPKFGNFADPGVEFDLMMHLGTALSISIYFYKEIKSFLIVLPQALFPFVQDEKNTQVLHFVRNMVFTTIVTLICALVLKTYAIRLGRSVNIIAFNLIFFGLLLWIADKKTLFNISTLKTKFDFKSSLFLGVLQSFAVFPGVSRSGVLLTGTRFLGIKKVEGSEFTFLLSLPIIFAGIIHKLPAIILGSKSIGITYWLLGTFVSFFVGLCVIHFFMKFISKIGFLPFFIYRLILGLCIIYFLS